MAFLRAVLVALAMTAAALPAAADIYRFDVSDPDASLGGQPLNPYHFFIDTASLPGVFDADTFTVDGTTYGHTFSDVAILDTYTFYTDAAFGGFADLENIYEGPALFDGPTSAPVFKVGTFALDDFIVPVSVTISRVAAPEPVTLSLFGVGLVGAMALRRRRARA